MLQVESYLDAHNGLLSSTALYSVYIGGNDYIDTLAGAGNATVEDVLLLTEAALDLLYDAGARL